MAIPPGRPPDTSHAPPSKSTRPKPSRSRASRPQQPPNKNPSNYTHATDTNNVTRNLNRQTRQYKCRPFPDAKQNVKVKMATLPLPQIIYSATELNEAIQRDPKYNYPPREWNRISKSRQNKIRAQYIKYEKSATASTSLSPLKFVAATATKVIVCNHSSK